MNISIVLHEYDFAGETGFQMHLSSVELKSDVRVEIVEGGETKAIIIADIQKLLTALKMFEVRADREKKC